MIGPQDLLEFDDTDLVSMITSKGPFVKVRNYLTALRSSTLERTISATALVSTVCTTNKSPVALQNESKLPVSVEEESKVPVVAPPSNLPISNLGAKLPTTIDPMTIPTSDYALVTIFWTCW
jgi:hypothetical protein